MRFVGLLQMLLVFAWVGAATADEIVVIVHPERVVDLGPSDLAQIYLKQRRFWSDGKPIVAVNRNAGSEARESFSEAVFGAEARGHVAYWNRQYFKGILPPLTLASDEAVLRFVAADSRAIGYVHSSRVDETVRVALRLKTHPGD